MYCLCTCKIILEVNNNLINLVISVFVIRYVPELANYLTSILDCFSSENGNIVCFVFNQCLSSY